MDADGAPVGINIRPAWGGIRIVGHPLGSDEFCRAFYDDTAKKTEALVASLKDLTEYSTPKVAPSGVFSGPIAGLPRSSHFVGPSGGAQQSASFAALQRSILAGSGFRPVRWLANRAWFVVGSESSPWGGRTVSKAQNFSAGLFEGCRQTPGKLRR